MHLLYGYNTPVVRIAHLLTAIPYIATACRPVNQSDLQPQTVRLAKRVAEQLGISRTEATQYIEGGWVQVDGVVTELAGTRVAAEQNVILLDGAALVAVEPVTILFHKPAGVSDTELADPHSGLIDLASRSNEDRSGINFLQRHTRDLKMTTRLDNDASGLVVLTQDYRIIRKLVDDANRIEHELVVDVTGTMKEGGIDLLQNHASWNGKLLNSLKVSWQSEQRLRFALKGLQAGMIQHLCAQVDIKCVATKRLRIGRISLASLPVGQWRYLAGYERF